MFGIYVAVLVYWCLAWCTVHSFREVIVGRWGVFSSFRIYGLVEEGIALYGILFCVVVDS